MTPTGLTQAPKSRRSCKAAEEKRVERDAAEQDMMQKKDKAI